MGLKNMWDSVVSWMKMAVDFIALDSPAEADPDETPSPSRVRVLFHYMSPPVLLLYRTHYAPPYMYVHYCIVGHPMKQPLQCYMHVRN